MDFMTAYLATSGRLDTVAIIAAGTQADMSFIMALQTLRLFTILLTGPAMARAISAMRRGNKSSQSEAGRSNVRECARAICYQAFRAASAAS